MNKAATGAFVTLLLAAAPVLAATIDVGQHALIENTADQRIEICVIPGDPVEEISNVDLFAQIADGGPEMGGSIDGPEFMALDFSNSLFENDAIHVSTIADGGQIVIGGAILAQVLATVEARGLLLSLIVDTTEFFVGDPRDPWDLKLVETLDLPTTLARSELVDPGPPPTYVSVEVPVTIVNGTITLHLAPEPSTIAMLLGLLAGMACLLVRRKGCRR